MSKNLFSPTMLKKYLGCKYIIFNEINEKKLNLKKIELNINDKVRFEKGNQHEKNYLKELKNNNIYLSKVYAENVFSCANKALQIDPCFFLEKNMIVKTDY